MRAVNVPALLAAFRAARPAVAVEIRHGGGSNVLARQIREGASTSPSCRFPSGPRRG